MTTCQTALAFGHLWCTCAAVSSVRLPFFRQCAHSALSPLHFCAPIMRPLCTVSHRCSVSSCGMAQWPRPLAILPTRALFSSSVSPASMASCLPPGSNTLGICHFSASNMARTCAVPAPWSGTSLLAVAVSFCRHPMVRASGRAGEPLGASAVCGSSASSAAATFWAVSAPCSASGCGSLVFVIVVCFMCDADGTRTCAIFLRFLASVTL